MLVTSCWFYWRNYRLYGDPSGATALLEIFGRAARALVLVKRGEALWPSRCVACLSLLATMLFALYGYSIFAFYARGGSPYARYLFPALPVIAAAIALALDSLRLQTAAVIAISALVFTNLVNLAGFARSLDKLGAHGLVLQTSLATNGHERTAVKEPAHGSRPVSRDW